MIERGLLLAAAAAVNSSGLAASDTGFPRWPTGVALVLTGSLVGTAGNQLIRTSELRMLSNRPKDSRIFFAAGMGMNMLLSPVFDLSGYAFAPASVIAPFTASAIVWNTLIAPFTMGETLTRRRLLSAVIVFLTSTATVFFKQDRSVIWTVERVHQVFLRWPTFIYCTCFFAWFFVNTCFLMKYPKGSVVRGFSLGATAGSLAGNMWCTRITAVFMADCLNGHCEAWTDWSAWVVLLGAIFFALLNIPYMARGMKQYEVLFMVTLFMGSNIVANCVSAAVVLNEMDGEPWWKVAGYVSCILGMIGGMTLLAKGEISRSAMATPIKDDESQDTANEDEGEETDEGEANDAVGYMSALCKTPTAALGAFLNGGEAPNNFS
ncbi:unnamed protein product [Polarella glacialis]|uniref:Uncharacterized protein n=1 Tax=Polarella glacialis TaxID=89957 RepID=A0A813LSF7_POLGL|nr:unnamed protein product [Polarella glacialis]